MASAAATNRFIVILHVLSKQGYSWTSYLPSSAGRLPTLYTLFSRSAADRMKCRLISSVANRSTPSGLAVLAAMSGPTIAWISPVVNQVRDIARNSWSEAAAFRNVRRNKSFRGSPRGRVKAPATNGAKRITTSAGTNNAQNPRDVPVCNIRTPALLAAPTEPARMKANASGETRNDLLASNAAASEPTKIPYPRTTMMASSKPTARGDCISLSPNITGTNPIRTPGGTANSHQDTADVCPERIRPGTTIARRKKPAPRTRRPSDKIM